MEAVFHQLTAASSSLELKVQTQIQALASMDEKCKPWQIKFTRN